MALWRYVTSPTGDVLGPKALLAISVGFLVAAGGIALSVIPDAILRTVWDHLPRRASGPDRGNAGLGEYALRTEFWSKLGMSIAVWTFAFLIALSMRIAGTSQLATRELPALVALIGVLIFGYVVVYRAVVYPRYLAECRRIDTRRVYEEAKFAGGGKGKKGASRAPSVRPSKVEMWPEKATIGLFVVPIIYFLALAPSDPTHDHLFHLAGVLAIAPLGYVLGLVFSLGDGLRRGTFWVQPGRTRAAVR